MRKRVLVLFESGRTGAAVLDVAREMTAREGAQLTVVCVAPQVSSGHRCGYSALAYNDTLIDATRADLQVARERLGDAGGDAAFELLLEGLDPSFHDLAAGNGFDLVLLPAHTAPLRGHTHPAAARIRSEGVEVRVVEPERRATGRL